MSTRVRARAAFFVAELYMRGFVCCCVLVVLAIIIGGRWDNASARWTRVFLQIEASACLEGGFREMCGTV